MRGIVWKLKSINDGSASTFIKQTCNLQQKLKSEKLVKDSVTRLNINTNYVLSQQTHNLMSGLVLKFEIFAMNTVSRLKKALKFLKINVDNFQNTLYSSF